jgi:hypothetical protein
MKFLLYISFKISDNHSFERLKVNYVTTIMQLRIDIILNVNLMFEELGTQTLVPTTDEELPPLMIHILVLFVGKFPAG